MPLSLYDRAPTVHADAVNAFERAQVASGKVDRSLGQTAALDVASLLTKKVQSAKEDGRLPGRQGLEQVADIDIREKLETALDKVSLLYGAIGIKTPDTAQIAEAADLAALAEAYTDMPEAEFVLTPAKLTVAEAKRLYSSLTPTDAAPLQNGGLFINDNIEKHWDEITLNDQLAPNTIEDDTGRKWTLRAIPGTTAPTKTNVDHNSVLPPLHHPTISDYLTLQALRIQRGDEPVDALHYTWLCGSYDGGKDFGACAPAGVWNSGVGRVRLPWGQVGCRRGNLGVRPSVG